MLLSNSMPNHEKIAPIQKAQQCSHSPRDWTEKSRVVASIWYGATTDAGWMSFDDGERSNEWPFW